MTNKGACHLIAGMFMVCIDMRDKDGTLLSHSCRTAMLHYRSDLLLTLKTLLLSPFFMLGSTEEKQGISIELFSDYEEDAVSANSHKYTNLI